ncbi:MAG: hypothetical protein HYS08_00860 [Chlamydiae bacterium]|nr:hypothetical protein [Chlamydiota bacterium]MBI3265660.1 hypothetical protein [Chlamydiota bacterium]
MENELGVQPLDVVMSQLGISNSDLVHVSKEQLTFKMVRKGRMGRRITPNIQNKIQRALQAASPTNAFTLKDLFNY